MHPKKRQMAPLICSPPEILQEIFLHLDPADLFALIQTHRHLRPVVEPLLYAQIKWQWTESHNPPIIQFLRTAIQRPELAAYVRAAVLSGDDFDASSLRNWEHQSPKLAVTDDDLESLIEAITKLNVAYSHEWIQELQSGTMEAFVALLLLRLPNLTSLYLGQNFTRQSRFVGCVLRSSLWEKTSGFHPFAHLRDVSIVYPTIGLEERRRIKTRNTEDVLPLFYLPAVERIKTAIDNPLTTLEWPGIGPPLAPSIKFLDLTRTREGGLGKLLSVTPRLESLTWDWYYRSDLEEVTVTNTIHLNELGANLALVCDTLTSLKITALVDLSRGDIEPPEVFFEGPFSIFSDLQNLKILEVPIPFLFGFSKSDPRILGLNEVLPNSLEWLNLTDDLCLQQEWMWEWEITHLLTLLSSWFTKAKQYTPHLRGIRFILQVMKVRDWPIHYFREFGLQAAQAGFQFEIFEKGQPTMLDSGE